MSRTRWIFGYFTRIVIVCFIVVLSTGCQKKAEELELKEVSAESVDISEEDEDISREAEDTDISSGVSDPRQEEESLDETVSPGKLYVHVCGHVEHPGVYEFQSGSRVYEAIEAAGGMDDTAAFSYLNQAELLQDGQKIYVPSQEEVDSGKFSSGSNETDGSYKDEESKTDDSKESDGKVNLNTATKEELMTLNGIGDVRAQAILQYREEHGEFRSITELMEVEGIKKGTFQKLKDQIKI